jgi:hypothetical protein
MAVNGTSGMAALWVRVLGTAGVTGAIALYLVWQLGSQLPEHARREEQRFEVLKGLLYQICVNTSRDAASQVSCHELNRREP